jgi:parallel beta-helix repeat protein
VEGASDVLIENNIIEGFDQGISIHNSPGTTARRNKIIGPKRPWLTKIGRLQYPAPIRMIHIKYCYLTKHQFRAILPHEIRASIS